jgi:hypothetical protein
MAKLDTEPVETGFMTGIPGTDNQDLLRVLEQLEIQDLGELSAVAWRII